MRVPRVAVALLGIAALALAGCSGGGSGGDASGGGGDAAACEPAPEGEKVELTFTAFTPKYDQVVDLWNQQNPDIQVKYNAAPAGNEGTYQNYFNQLKAGSAPDMGFIEFAPLPSYRVQDGLFDISACEGIPEAEDLFIPWTWQQMSLGTDAVYGLPHDVSPMGMYLRTDLFEGAGIAPPTTWDEYYEAAKAVRAAGGYITNLPPDWSAQLAGLVDQAGGQWFDTGEAGWKVSLTDEPTQRVLEYWQRMLDEKLVTTYPSFGDEMNQAWQNGTLWGTLAASWTSAFLKSGAPDTAGLWSAHLLPQWEAGEARSGSWGGGGIAVFSSTKHPYESAQFIKFVLTDPEALSLNNANAGVFPATVTALDDVENLQQPDPFFGGQRIWEVFAESAADLNYNWLWGPAMVATDSAVADGVTAAIQGRGTLLQALENAQTETVDALEAQGITVVN